MLSQESFQQTSVSEVCSDRRQIGFWETPKSDFVFVWKIYIRYTTDVVVYKPVGVTPKVGVLFYAGNPVDYRDYGTLCKRVASAGYLVISPEFPSTPPS